MTGILIGAAFGTVFVLINAGEPLPPAAGVALRVLAVVALVAVILMQRRYGRRIRQVGTPTPPTPTGRPRNMFGRGYWVIVVIEAVLLFGGLRVLGAVGQPAQVNVAWIAIVVGVHFLVLAPVWKERSILVPGVVLTLLGVIGFVLSTTSALAWVPVVSGVLSGFTLLGGSLMVARHALTSDVSQRDLVE